MFAAPPTIGDVIDAKYRIIRLLGRGGMGAVYLAEHIALKRPVALKLMGEALRANEQYVRRFEREAKATFGLEHRNIVRVYDYGQEPAPYLVMEWIEGETLKERLNQMQEPPPLAWVRHVMAQIFEALDAAHSNGIVHRDLKPENILLRADANSVAAPVLKVVDFGMARIADVADGEPTLTKLDFVAGTPAYMSPEQCRSLVVGPASDLYAAGCILTELLQLSPPFRSGSPAELMSQQMFAPPPQLLRPPAAQPVPPALERLRKALLAKHLHQRPASAAQALAELHACFSESVPPPAYRGSMAEQLRPNFSSEAPTSVPHDQVVYIYDVPTLPNPLSEVERIAWASTGTEIRQWPKDVEDFDAGGGLVLIPCVEPTPAISDAVLRSIRQVKAAHGTAVVVGTGIPASVLPSWIEAGVAHVVERAEPVSVNVASRRSAATEPTELQDISIQGAPAT